MAISRADCLVWRTLRSADLIPDHPLVLEIGRANWYGDTPQEEVISDAIEFGPMVYQPEDRHDAWTKADWYYDLMLRCPKRTAIDLDPHAPDVLRWNLNDPIAFVAQDIVINTGTTEHVFDQRQVWETIHDATRKGGLMVHAMPLWGWFDHGFVNYQPTFVADLAAENSYDILLWIFAEMNPFFAVKIHEASDFDALYPRSRDRSAMMHVVFRKTRDESFRVPMQGVYSSRARPEQSKRWRENRGGPSRNTPEHLNRLAEEARQWDSRKLTPAGWTKVPRGDSAINVTADQLFARIGALTVERDVLLAQNDAHCEKIASLLDEVKALRDKQADHAETNGVGVCN